MRKMTEPKQWTLLSALETIWKAAKGSEISDEFLERIKEPSAYVQQKFGINAVQTALLAVLADANESLASRQIANYLGCSNLSLLARVKELNELCDRHMLHHERCLYRGEETDGFCIETHCLECIKENLDFAPEDLSKLSAWQFLQRVGRWMRETDRNSENYNNMEEQIIYLIKNTQHLKLSKYLAECLEERSLSTCEMVFFLLVCFYQIERRRPFVSSCQYDDIMSFSYCCSEICDGINDGNGALYKFRLLENDNSDGVAERDVFRLTKDACIGVLSDYKYRYRDGQQHTEALIRPEDIVSKKLFFNPEEGKQIERLRDLLSPENFNDVQKRLKESGLRAGFCVLMHGEPGSGKTESVYQVCKESGHPIFQVNISEMKSKWVGDSEKLVQGMFDRYNSFVKDALLQGKPIPVLFLNEADAIMGRRLKGANADSPVSKMENALQNIILQEMERMEGVLVATTNLTDNLDDAMTRRWIFTIRYDKPSADVKAKIFKAMIPDLSAKEAKSLAVEFPDFCGGQCENVTRRLKVEHVLYNTPFTVDRVRELCREEGIKKVASRNSIGFH